MKERKGRGRGRGGSKNPRGSGRGISIKAVRHLKLEGRGEKEELMPQRGRCRASGKSGTGKGLRKQRAGIKRATVG